MEKALPPVVEDRFLGMVANSDARLRKGEALLAENLWLDEGRWRLKPGQVNLGASGGPNPVQNIVHWETLGGVKTLTAFINGGMYEYDWNAGTWTGIALGGGVVVDAASVPMFEVSRGRLIVADRVNRPWMLEKDLVGARTFTLLNAAPIAGGIAIYYDKPFFSDIPALPVSFEWGNEADPTTGYAANDQSWEFAQTDQGAVVAQAALDGVLCVFKEDSATWVKGAVDEEFRTRANREGISTSEGAAAKRCVIVADEDVYFLSARGARKARGGEFLEPIDERAEEGNKASVHLLRDLWAGLNLPELNRAHAVFDSVRRLVLFFVPEGVSTNCTRALVYHIDSEAWSTFTFSTGITCACMAEDADGVEHLLVGTTAGSILRFDDEVLSDAGVAIAWTLRSRKYGSSSPAILKRLAEVRVVFNKSTANLAGSMSYNANGSIAGAKTFDFDGTPTGKKRYRRGFNITAPELGWQVSGSATDEAIEIVAALTALTAVGSESSGVA